MNIAQRNRLADLRELDSIDPRTGYERTQLDRLETLAREDAHGQALQDNATLAGAQR